MATANSENSPNSAMEPKGMTIKVNLDAERLKAKWQTLCIDLDKIVGSKLGS